MIYGTEAFLGYCIENELRVNIEAVRSQCWYQSWWPQGEEDAREVGVHAGLGVP